MQTFEYKRLINKFPRKKNNIFLMTKLKAENRFFI